MRVLEAVRPKLVIELGTAHGNTTANICSRFSCVRVVTVDAPKSVLSGSIVTFSLDKSEIGRVYHHHGFTGRVDQVFQNTLRLNLDEYVDSESADVAIVDACHDTDYVLNDFERFGGTSGRTALCSFMTRTLRCICICEVVISPAPNYDEGVSMCAIFAILGGQFG